MTVKRWGRSVLVVVVLLLPVAVIAAMGVASGGGSGSEAPSDEPDDRQPQILPAVPVPGPPVAVGGGAVAVPTTVPAGAGESGVEVAEVEVLLYHCGFEPIEALGRTWIVEPAPFDETNAPADFAGAGVLTANDDGTATYLDNGGREVELTERPPDHRPPPCD